MGESEPAKSVLIKVRDAVLVRDWCVKNIPSQFHPIISVRETTTGEYVVRATFFNEHYAALYRLFWDEGK
jgi:hypothetical protein